MVQKCLIFWEKYRKMKILMYFFAIFTLSIWLVGCSGIYHKSRLTFINSPFELSKIPFRIDGYYYNERTEKHYNWGHDAQNNTVQKVDYLMLSIRPMFFYADGYIKNIDGAYSPENYTDSITKKAAILNVLAHVESIIKKNKNVRITDNVEEWGLYRMNNGDLEIQYYFNHFGSFRLIELKVKVLDSETLLVKHRYSSYFHNAPRVIDEDVEDIYKFRQFTEKPDSSNYIKEHTSKFLKK
jgi:hypothetical protein